jgi:hypothetical protein
MLLVGLMVAAALVLSSKTVRAAVPFESLLAVGTCGALAVLLYQLDRLA